MPCLCHTFDDLKPWPDRLRIRHDCDPWRLPYSTPDLIRFVSGKGVDKIPEGGWSASTFATEGEWLMTTTQRLAQIVQRKAVPFVARTANGIFQRQVDEVIKRVTSRGSTVELLFPQHEGLWFEAIKDVFEKTGADITVELIPPIQSVMAQGYSKVGKLLGHTPRPDANQLVIRKSQAIAEKITRINDTTRNVIQRTIHQAVEDGASVLETAERVRVMVPEINRTRSLTIARTELNNAWTAGAAESYKEADRLTHLSVIGCEAREANSPQFRGESTCNIEDVPIHDLDALLAVGWHPNHTGSLVPSSFR